MSLKRMMVGRIVAVGDSLPYSFDVTVGDDAGSVGWVGAEGSASPASPTFNDLVITSIYMNSGSVYMTFTGVSYPGDVWDGYGGIRTLRIHTRWGYFDCDFDVPLYYDTALGELGFDGLYATSKATPAYTGAFMRGWEGAFDVAEVFAVEFLSTEPEALTSADYNMAGEGYQDFTVTDLGSGVRGFRSTVNSLTPAATCYGAEILEFSSNGSYVWTLILKGDLPQDWFFGLSSQIPRNTNLVSLDPATADSYSSSGTQTTWTWNKTADYALNATDEAEVTFIEFDAV